MADWHRVLEVLQSRLSRNTRGYECKWINYALYPLVGRRRVRGFRPARTASGSAFRIDSMMSSKATSAEVRRTLLTALAAVCPSRRVSLITIRLPFWRCWGLGRLGPGTQRATSATSYQGELLFPGRWGRGALGPRREAGFSFADMALTHSAPGSLSSSMH
jgi:hypothetical protein